MNTLELHVGRTYYRVTYADRDATMPSIEPLVYIGNGTTAQGGAFYAFQDTVSYVRYGSRLAPGAVDRDDLCVYFLPAAGEGVDVLDLEHVAECVQECLQRAVSTGYPVLPVVRDGWSPTA